MKTSTLALAALFLAIGCGRVVTTDDSSPSPITGEKDAAVEDVTPPPEVPDVITADVTVPPTEGGACSFTPWSGAHVAGGGGIKCQVATGVHQDHGSPVNDLETSSVGSATLTGQELRLSCGDAGNVLMSAVIDCYQGAGTYEVAAGALVLGGKTSDRKCRLQADLTEGELRGFIDCDKAPADPTNVFANTSAPVGLGVYAFPFR